MSRSFHGEVGKQVAAGVESASFFASIMSGLLLGFIADSIFGTRPLFIVIGIITGSVVGFWRMWQIASQDDA